jgi:hypothetical protein
MPIFMLSIGVLMIFNIDDSFLTSVSIYKEWGMFDNKTDLTHEQLIKVIKGTDRSSSISSEDHPEFAKLREQLGKDGYIKIQRSWWNGDEVTKPFTLNGVLFKNGSQFPSACAMTGHLMYTTKFGN